MEGPAKSCRSFLLGRIGFSLDWLFTTRGLGHPDSRDDRGSNPLGSTGHGRTCKKLQVFFLLGVQMYRVYLLISLKSGIFYIGQTKDLLVRLDYHNKGRSTYTRNKGPWALLAYKSYPSRGDAMKEEQRLKQLKNRSRILQEFGFNSSEIHLIEHLRSEQA